MKGSFPNRLFITGTGTGVGKTVVSAILVAGLQGRYWKPVQCGLDEITDTQWVREYTGMPESCFYPETYRLKHPLSPHTAAAKEGVDIKLDNFHIPGLKEQEPLIVEGAGGIMVPLNDHHFMLDLIKKLNFPVLLVTSSLLGTINHTLLSLEQMKRDKIDVFGVVMNGPKNPENRKAIEHFGKVDVCGEIEHLPTINRKKLIECFTFTMST